MTHGRPSPAFPEPLPGPASFVRQFLKWSQEAAPDEREAAASALARAYLYADLSERVRDECAVAMTALLDDPRPGVRRALAEAFAGSRAAPRALVIALAADRADIASPLLARSPLLTDAELVDLIAASEDQAQCAVARRAGLGASPAAALAEVGGPAAALALIGNRSAMLAPASLGRILERFKDDAEIRTALADRGDLPAKLRAEMAIAAAESRSGSGEGPVERRATRDAALAAIAADCAPHEMTELVRTLRVRGALTLALLLRSVLSGERALLEAALAELTGLTLQRVEGFVADPGGSGFAAVTNKAGLPNHTVAAFRAALSAMATRGPGERRGLRADLVSTVIEVCEARHDPALAPVVALLWRLAAEATRQDVRTFANAVPAQPELPDNLAFPASNDDATAAGDPPPIELPPDLRRRLVAA
jgi:uncharacterized protein (DUF2336 family)